MKKYGKKNRTRSKKKKKKTKRTLVNQQISRTFDFGEGLNPGNRPRYTPPVRRLSRGEIDHGTMILPQRRFTVAATTAACAVDLYAQLLSVLRGVFVVGIKGKRTGRQTPKIRLTSVVRLLLNVHILSTVCRSDELWTRL